MKTPNNGVETSQNQPQKMGAIKGLSAKIVTALAAIGIATSAEKVEAATIIPLGEMNSQQLNTLKTNPTDHQEVLTSLTFTTTTAGTINVKMNYLIDGINIGTGVGQTVDLGGIIQREFTGLANVTILDTTSIAAGVTGTDGNLATRFDQKNTIENPLLDTFSISGPGTYTLSYKGALDSKYITGQMLFGNATDTNLTTPIQVSFTPVIPEPGVGLLAGIGGSLALLRRKRKEAESTNTSAE